MYFYSGLFVVMLVVVWYCVGKRSWFVKSFHYVNMVCVFVFCMLLSRLFVFVALVTVAWYVLANVFGYDIHARARLIIRYSACDLVHTFLT